MITDDKVLISKALDMLHSRARRYVTLADVLAVVEHESHGSMMFTEGDKQFKDNLHAAQQITGLSADEICEANRILAGPLAGEVAKFRVELGYFSWACHVIGTFSTADRMLLGSSYGYGQKMTRWLVENSKLGKSEWISFIQGFMGNAALQLLYVCGDLEGLMVDTQGDKTLAFARYNGGARVTTKGITYQHYGLPVAKRAQEIAHILEEKTCLKP